MRPYRLASALLLSTLLAPVHPALAQTRLSDKDVQHLMENLHQDAKNFENPFKDALHRSSIRKTTQERDARDLSKRLTQQTNGLIETFKHHHHPEAALQTVNATVQQIDPIVATLPQDSQATAQWDKVHADLSALAPAFN